MSHSHRYNPHEVNDTRGAVSLFVIVCIQVNDTLRFTSVDCLRLPFAFSSIPQALTFNGHDKSCHCQSAVITQPRERRKIHGIRRAKCWLPVCFTQNPALSIQSSSIL
ncbi:hypothetical protein AC1031_022123 [Aphanomyces cochlioides]|nr:hypothetical protein AC1031_022123 [Aphanomyces cochlioides]